MICFCFFFVDFLISRYDVIPSLRGPSVVNLRALHAFFFFYIALSDIVFTCLPCIVIAVHVRLFTVKRFQHRKLASFNACFLQFRPAVPFSSVAKKGTSLCTLGGSKCLKVGFLCFLSRVPLLYESSICTTCCGFLFQQNTSKKDFSCHAKISVSTTAPMSASCCSSG